MSDFLHASAVVIGGRGILLRGPAGSGKTSLGRALIARAGAAGQIAAWVGDDRIGIRAAGGRVLLTPHPAIAGRVELRGFGIVAVAHVAEAELALVVDILAEPERLPADPHTAIAGVSLPRLQLRAHDPYGAESVLAALLAALLAAPLAEPLAASGATSPY